MGWQALTGPHPPSIGCPEPRGDSEFLATWVLCWGGMGLSTVCLLSFLRSRGPAAWGEFPHGDLRGLQLHRPVPGVSGRLSLPAEPGLGQELCQRRQGVWGRRVSRGRKATDRGPAGPCTAKCVGRPPGGPDPSSGGGPAPPQLPPLPQPSSGEASSVAPEGRGEGTWGPRGRPPQWEQT